MEEAAARYNPVPVDVGDIVLPEALAELTEALAGNTHDAWARSRMDQGWTYGLRRDDRHRKHPDLLPYELLPEQEKAYDRQSAIGAIKLIVKLGYTIRKVEGGQENE